MVFDVNGSSIITLHNGLLLPGETLVPRNGQDHVGKKVATGTYFYSLFVDGKLIESNSMIFIK